MMLLLILLGSSLALNKKLFHAVSELANEGETMNESFKVGLNQTLRLCVGEKRSSLLVPGTSSSIYIGNNIKIDIEAEKSGFGDGLNSQFLQKQEEKGKNRQLKKTQMRNDASEDITLEQSVTVSKMNNLGDNMVQNGYVGLRSGSRSVSAASTPVPMMKQPVIYDQQAQNAQNAQNAQMMQLVQMQEEITSMINLNQLKTNSNEKQSEGIKEKEKEKELQLGVSGQEMQQVDQINKPLQQMQIQMHQIQQLQQLQHRQENPMTNVAPIPAIVPTSTPQISSQEGQEENFSE